MDEPVLGFDLWLDDGGGQCEDAGSALDCGKWKHPHNWDLDESYLSGRGANRRRGCLVRKKQPLILAERGVRYLWVTKSPCLYSDRIMKWSCSA